jgi:hypothetical protein
MIFQRQARFKAGLCMHQCGGGSFDFVTTYSSGVLKISIELEVFSNLAKNQ